MLTSAPEPLLSVTALESGYGKIRVLHGVDMSIAAGEVVALLGPNGAGKTTLVLHLNGILGSVAGGTGSGRIEIGGTGLHREHLSVVRRKVGLVFQDPDDQLFMPEGLVPGLARLFRSAVRALSRPKAAPSPSPERAP